MMPCKLCGEDPRLHQLFGEVIGAGDWHSITEGRVTPSHTVAGPLLPRDLAPGRPRVRIPKQRRAAEDLEHRP